MKKSFPYLLLMIVPVALAILICRPAKPVAAPSKTVKIGWSAALNLAWGVDVSHALQLGVDLINRGGGLNVKGESYKIEYTVHDDKYRADEGRAAAERLVYQDKVSAIVGTVASPAAVGTLPVVQSAGIPFFTGGQSSKLVEPHLKYVYANSTYFHTELSYLLLLRTKPNIKTAFLAANDDEPGHDLTVRVSKVLNKYGVKILGTVFVPRTQTDYTPVATKVASLNPDLFATPGFGGVAEKTALMAKALYQTTWRGAFLITGAPVAKDIREMCPSGEAEGYYACLADFTIMPNPPPLALEIRKLFIEKYGEWRDVGPYWALPIWFYKAAVEKAGSFDPNKIDKAMAGLKVDTPIGEAIMIRQPQLGNTKYVQSLSTLALTQYSGGKYNYVGVLTTEEMIKELEKYYGFPGQWK
jgi:ABC-type branched-subunit amino acid transport system substrate-binding protein